MPSLNKSLGHLGDDLLVEGVAHIGAVQRDGGDQRVNVKDQVIHGVVQTTSLSTA
jgi:hypothetical protein